MTNQEILKIAMAQSSVDLCAVPEAFEKSENIVVTSRDSDGRDERTATDSCLPSAAARDIM